MAGIDETDKMDKINDCKYNFYAFVIATNPHFLKQRKWGEYSNAKMAEIGKNDQKRQENMLQIVVVINKWANCRIKYLNWNKNTSEKSL